MKTALLFLSLVLAAMFCGCKQHHGSNGYASKKIIIKKPKQDITLLARNKADSIVATMSMEEKVGQCFMPSMFSLSDATNMAKLESYINDLHVGGVVLLKGDVESAAILSGKGNKSKVPLFMAIDAEWGLGMRLHDAPAFPKNGEIGEIADEILMFDYGREIARESRRIGINMVLGPVVDVAENPDGMIGKRSFGRDAKKVADLGVAYAKGLESGGVLSVAKHFPGHGSSDVDSHKSLPVINRSLHDLSDIDLYPFQKYIDDGLSGVMVGHLALPAVDPEKKPAAVSRPIIEDLLREEMNFKGLVFTDALNMKGVKGFDSADALLAGADIIISPADTAGEIKKILQMIEKGEIEEEFINQKCRRILFYKLWLQQRRLEKISLFDILDDVKGDSDTLRARLSTVQIL